MQYQRSCATIQRIQLNYIKTISYPTKQSRTKLLAGQNFVFSKDFGHICPTNNFV